jgi:hypothetical protein
MDSLEPLSYCQQAQEKMKIFWQSPVLMEESKWPSMGPWSKESFVLCSNSFKMVIFSTQ